MTSPYDQSIQMLQQNIKRETMFHSDHKNMICYSSNRVCRLVLSVVLVVLLITVFQPFVLFPSKVSFRSLLRTNSAPITNLDVVMINGYAVEIDPNVASVIQHPDGSVSVVLTKEHNDASTDQSVVDLEPTTAAL